MKKALLVLFTLLVSFGISAQELNHDKKMKWWREARFGMFIHWGPYAIWGGEYKGHITGTSAWIMNRSKIPVAEYQEVTKTFNPYKYDPESWVRLAKEAGMKYIVFTAKHHDGFAMFKSDASKFNIVDFTEYKKDILKQLAEACRKHDMRLGIYYSQSQDWSNPGGTTHRRLMRQGGWPNPDSTRIDAYTALHKGSWDPVQQTKTTDEYFDEVAVPQVKELLENYGNIAVIWWDTPSYMTNEQADKMVNLLKKYPNVITNDRLKGDYPGDYRTPEQVIPNLDQLDDRDWESCMTIGRAWGYRKSNENWKTSETLIKSLIEIVSKGGNFLLNISPDSEGALPKENISRLKDISSWMKIYGDAIYETGRSIVEKPAWGFCTQKNTDNKTQLYLFVVDWPKDGKLILNTEYKAETAKLLHNNKKVDFENMQDGILIYVPTQVPNTIASVIEIEFNNQLPTFRSMKRVDEKFDDCSVHLVTYGGG